MELQEAMEKIRSRIERSIKQNFQQGGRPNPWEQSARTLVETKSKTDGKNRTGKTLIDTGVLRNSIRAEIQGEKIVAGTSVVYAAVHNFGGKIQKNVSVREHQRRTPKGNLATVKTHTRNMNLTIPQREFMMLQEQDIQYIIKQLKKVLDNEFTN